MLEFGGGKTQGWGVVLSENGPRLLLLGPGPAGGLGGGTGRVLGNPGLGEGGWVGEVRRGVGEALWAAEGLLGAWPGRSW